MVEQKLSILGLMSGTSMDGLDCCLAEISINDNYILDFKIIDSKTFQFDNKLIKKISSLVGSRNRKKINALDLELGMIYRDLAIDFLGSNKIDLISTHGQTLRHQDCVESLQIGHPKYLSLHFNVPIIYNFRPKDILLGGTGAPFVPYLDWLIFKESKKNVITINLGGISNITYIPCSGNRKDVVGFDTGPGMCYIDEFVKHYIEDSYDVNARYSQRGIVDDILLNELLKNKFVNLEPPKSTTREDFSKRKLLKIASKYRHLNKFDFLRTLVKFTADSISLNINNYIGKDLYDKIYISGGGAKHRILVEDLKENLSNLFIMDSCNISVDNKESFLMCVMGYSRIKNLYNNMPSVTGAKKLDVYGEIY